MPILTSFFRYRSVRFLCFVAILFCNDQESVASDNQPTLDVKNIPAELTYKTNAVVRRDITIISVTSFNTVRVKTERVVTIFDESEDNYATLSLNENEFVTVTKVEGTLFSSKGEVIRQLQSSDVTSRSAVRDELFSNSRIKNASFGYSKYPYTVRYTYEMDYKGTFFLPRWMPEEIDASVEYASLYATFPATAPLRWKIRGEVTPKRVSETDFFVELRHLKKVTIEPNSLHPLDQFLRISFTPAEFEMQGFKGKMTSWERFGLWLYKLHEGRDRLPESAVSYYQTLTQSLATDREKIKRVYEDIQQNTRYISVQLGVGGWQPFPAEYVHERGYGDCKGLSNYLYAILKTLGIESYPAVIYRGSTHPNLDPVFAENSFNHQVLMIPLKSSATSPIQDTLWIECTNQVCEFGHVAADIQDRYALVLTPQGGKLVKTPSSNSTANKTVKHLFFSLEPSGKARAEITYTLTGTQQDYYRHRFESVSRKDIVDYFSRSFSFSGYRISETDIKGLYLQDGASRMRFVADIDQFASQTGKRLFFKPNAISRFDYSTPEEKTPTRRHPFYFSAPFIERDSCVFTLPNGSTIETLPKPVTLSSSFGKYTSKVSVKGNQLIYVREFEITSSLISAKAYPELVRYFSAITRADNQKVVLLNP